MYLALNSLHVDERIAFLQVRRADRVQHIGQHIILLGWTTKFCSFPYIILSLLLLLPISLVLSYGCDNVENAASDYSYFFLLQHITAHIADYKKSRARSSTLYRKLFELRESQIFLKQIVLAAVIPSPVMGAISAAYRRVQSRVCCAVYTWWLRDELSCLYSPGQMARNETRDDPAWHSSQSTFRPRNDFIHSHFCHAPSSLLISCTTIHSTLDRVLTYLHADTAV